MLKNKRVKHGSFVFHDNDMIGHCLDLFGEWAENELSFLLGLIEAGDTVVDIGAHIGTFTVPFAKKVGPQGCVVALEPQRLIFQNLNANLVINHLTNVRAHHVLCGREPYFLELNEKVVAESENSGSFSVKPSARQPRKWSRTRAEPLDALLQGLPSLKLIKIDVEGFEQEVLAGAAETVARLRPIIHCECLNAASMAFLQTVAAEHRYRTYAASFQSLRADNFFGRPLPDLPTVSNRDTNVLLWPVERPLPDGLRVQDVATFADLTTAPSPRWDTGTPAPIGTPD